MAVGAGLLAGFNPLFYAIAVYAAFAPPRPPRPVKSTAAVFLECPFMPGELTSFDLEIRREVYDGAIERRRIPTISALSQTSQASTNDVRASLQRLADAHMLVLQRDGGEILMANPFSAVPTPFLVTTNAGSWYGNCIWDGMGIAAMLASDGVIDTSCGCCGTALRLDVPRQCRDDDERVVHFAIAAARWWNDIVFN